MSLDNKPPARFNAKFFSSRMPVKPVNAVGGLTCLDNKSRIYVIFRRQFFPRSAISFAYLMHLLTGTRYS
jgi:hypothetical protein